MRRRLLLGGLNFPEGLRWHEGRLWFSEMYRGEIWTVDLEGRSQRIAAFDDHTAGLGFMPDGSLIAVLKNTQRLVRIGEDGVSIHAELGGLGGNHLNDMVMDDRGRAYVTIRRSAPKLSSQPAGSDEKAEDMLVLVRPDGSLAIVAEGMLTPNGLAITPYGGTLIVAETRGCRLTAFPRDASTGLLGAAELFADLGDTRPDGICLDAEGAVWTGSPNAGRFVRIVRSRGIVHSIDMPGRFAVACVTGGKGRRTLFMASAITTWADIAEHKAEGSIDIQELDVPGAGRP